MQWVCAVLWALVVLGSSNRALANPMRDDLGEVFDLKAIPQRVVSLAPSNTELLYALGLGDRLVGVTEYCNYPPAAQSVAQVAGFNSVNLEKIALVRPDLVLAIRGNDMESLRSLRQLGIPVFSLDIQSLEGVGAALRRVGQLLGVAQRGHALADSLDVRIAAVRSRAAGARVRPTAMWGFWGDPIYTAGAQTMIDDVLNAAGGDNVGRRAQGAWPQISLETVVMWSPDILFTTHVPGGSQNLAAEVERLQQTDGWKLIPAVRHRRVYYVEGDWLLRPGPRLVDALEHIAECMHSAGRKRE